MVGNGVIDNSSDCNSNWRLVVRAFEEDCSVGNLTWPPRSYSCAFCRREFRSAQALGGHMNVHRRQRPHHNNNINNTHSVIPNPNNHHHTNTITTTFNFPIFNNLHNHTHTTVASTSTNIVNVHDNEDDDAVIDLELRLGRKLPPPELR